MKSLEDARGRTLLAALDSIAVAKVATLVLLGDIFDFCLGSNRYFRRKFAPVGERLTRIATTGTRVIFFEGNHEFDLAGFGWDGVEFVGGGDLQLDIGNGERALLAHGDMIYSSNVYKSFRWLVKSRPVKKAASTLPGNWVESFALKNSDASRAYDRFREIDHGAILGAARTWLAGRGCQHGIFGHFHVPYAEPHGHGTIMSLDCWDKPNLLVQRPEGFARIFLDGDSRLEPLQPLVKLP